MLSWAGSFILSTPILIYQRIEEGYWYGPRQYCMERFPSKAHERAFILYQFIAAYLLPVLTISFCYTLMVKRVGQPTVEPVDNNYQVQAQCAFCSTIITLVNQIKPNRISRQQLMKFPVKVWMLLLCLSVVLHERELDFIKYYEFHLYVHSTFGVQLAETEKV